MHESSSVEDPPTARVKEPRDRRRKNKPSQKDAQAKDRRCDSDSCNVIERPHQASLYLPVKVERTTAVFLVDSGCTTNILSKRIFDRLPEAVRRGLQAHQTDAGLLVDGSRITLMGTIRLMVRVRAHQSEEIFWVSKIREDGILGMPFLTERHCSIDFSQQRLAIGDYEAQCTDRFGRSLAASVQLVKAVEIPAGCEKLVLCHVPMVTSTELGVVSGQCLTVNLAASLNQLDKDRRLLVRCLNWGSGPIRLPAGRFVGLFSCIEAADIDQIDAVRPVSIAGGTKDASASYRVPEHLVDLFERVGRSCQSDEQKRAVAALLVKYSDVFSSGDRDMGSTGLVKHEIPVSQGTRPIRQPARRLGPEREAEVERQVRDLHDRGLIEPANGGWSSPVVLVKKKDNTWRFCVDYRKLNSVTRQDAFPLPRIDESLDALAGSRFFSTLDLLSGYWQVPLSEDAQEKAAFVTRSGLWKWKVMPFGLTSAPATFQRLMEQVLRGLHWKTLLLYLDDVIVISPTFESHLDRLAEVFERLRKAGLKLKPSKCELFPTWDT